VSAIRPYFAFGFAALAVLALGAVRPRVALAHPDGSYPRTFNIDWTNDPNARLNSRYDMVSLGGRATRAKFDSIRALNPNCISLITPAWYAYYDAGPSGYPPISGPWAPDDPNYGFDRRFWDLINNNGWWCWAVDSVGTRYHATAYWRMWLGNFSTKCPPNAQGKRLCDVFADFLVDDLIASRGPDGLFFDQLWNTPTWLNGQMGGCQPGTNCTVQTPGTYFRTWFDLDGNFVADQSDSAGVWWSNGIKIVFQKLRQRLGNDFVIMGNGMHRYYDANGAWHERFPYIHNARDPEPNPYGMHWIDSMTGTRNGYLTVWPNVYKDPVRCVIDTEISGGDRWNFPTSATHQQFFRFGLGSALLGDGYFDLNKGTYDCYYWQPEYDKRLGWPRGPAVERIYGSARVWKREYTNGEVWVNPRSVPLSAGADHPAVAAWDAVITEYPETLDTTPLPGATIALESPRPNPMVASTTLSFRLLAGENAKLEIVDLKGRRIRHVWTGVGTGASQAATWDGRTDEGYDVPTGVYFAYLEGEAGRRSQQKMILAR
jgi:hypothetical protein